MPKKLTSNAKNGAGKMTETIKQFPDGLYFNMPFKVYAAQDRRSTSAVNTLNRGSLVYYEDYIAPTLEPDYDPEAVIEELTQSLAEGKAWHDIVLEGEDVFWSRNGIGFNAEGFPKALNSSDDYKARCKHYGLSMSGTKAAMKESILHHEARYDGKGSAPLASEFIDDLKAKHLEGLKGKNILTQAQYDQIKRAGEIMEQYGIRESWITGGFPEVSILFTLGGVKFKVRVDYLRPDMQIEYKTIANKFSKVLDEAATGQIHDHGYLTGAFLYQEAVAFARGALLDDLGFAHGLPKTQESTDWIDDFIRGGEGGLHEYWFLIQQRGKYNHALLRKLPKYDHNRKMTSMYRTGKLRVERAVNLYNWHMENNGLEKRWLPALNPKEFDDSDFKPWQLEE